MSPSKLQQEPDRIRAGRVSVVLGATLVLFAAGAWWSTSVLRTATGSARSDAAPPPEHAGDLEVGMVFQRPFDTPRATSKDEKNEAARRKLESTGWVDRDAGVAHVPIDQAMDLLVRRGAL